MTTKPLRRPRDPFALAKLIGDIATGQVDDGKDAVAVSMGKRGGAARFGYDSEAPGVDC